MQARNKRETRMTSGTRDVEETARMRAAFRKRDAKVLVKRVSHIAIVVKDIYDALSTFDKFFEFVREVRVENLPEQGVRVAIISFEGVELEFMQPIKPDTGIARFLERRGEGLHHIAFEVDDIEETLRSVGSKGARLIDKEPWQGVRGRTSFVHPSSLKGVLVELVQSLPESEGQV